jgi:hypothetical protein
VGHGRPSRARAAAGEAVSRPSWAGAASVRECDRVGWQGGGQAREVASGLSRAGATARPGRRLAGKAAELGRWQVRRRRRRAGRKRRCSRRPAAAHGRGLAARTKSEWAARTSE